MSDIEELKQIVKNLAEIVGKVVDTSCVKNSDMTLNELFELYINNRFELGKIKRNTYNEYLGTYNYHIREKIGFIKLSELSSENVELALNSIDKGRTREKMNIILNGVFAYGVRKKYLSQNLCDYVEVKKYVPTKRNAMTEIECNSFLKAIKDYPTGFQFLVYYETGIRCEEIKNIELHYDGGNSYITVKGTKSKTSVRDIPVTKAFADKLKKFYSRGGVFTVNNVNRKMRTLCDKAGISNYTVHCLRHTFATRCYLSGVPIERISYWLGHSSISVTEIYIHKLVGIINGDSDLIDKVNEKTKKYI